MSVRRRPNRQTEGAAPLDLGGYGALTSSSSSSELMRQQAQANATADSANANPLNGSMEHFSDVVDAATAAAARANATSNPGAAASPSSSFAGLRAAAAAKTTSAAHVLEAQGWQSAGGGREGGLGGYSGPSAHEPRSDGELLSRLMLYRHC